MAYQGIIFDFNGVLWWDTELQGESWSRYAEMLRGSRLSQDEIDEHVVGRDNRYILHYLTGEHFYGRALEEHTDHKETIYRNLCLEQGPAFRLSPGAADLLDSIKELGVKRTIATSAGLENMLFYFLHLDLGRWFDLGQVVYDDDQIATKPAPDPYLLAAQYLGLRPEQCVVVEDSAHGILAAQLANIGCIIAIGPAHRHASLRNIEGVQHTVENLGQVPADSLFTP